MEYVVETPIRFVQNSIEHSHVISSSTVDDGPQSMNSLWFRKGSKPLGARIEDSDHGTFQSCDGSLRGDTEKSNGVNLVHGHQPIFDKTASSIGAWLVSSD